MKTIAATITFMILSVMLYSQSVENNPGTNKLTGKWFLSHQTNNQQEMLFEKAKSNQLRWGDYITILSNGELIVGHSARCGNDPNRFRKTGNWIYQPENNKFKTSISIHKMGKTFSLKLLSGSKLVLE